MQVAPPPGHPWHGRMLVASVNGIDLLYRPFEEGLEIIENADKPRVLVFLKPRSKWDIVRKNLKLICLIGERDRYLTPAEALVFAQEVSFGFLSLSLSLSPLSPLFSFSFSLPLPLPFLIFHCFSESKFHQCS